MALSMDIIHLKYSNNSHITGKRRLWMLDSVDCDAWHVTKCAKNTRPTGAYHTHFGLVITCLDRLPQFLLSLSSCVPLFCVLRGASSVSQLASFSTSSTCTHESRIHQPSSQHRIGESRVSHGSFARKLELIAWDPLTATEASCCDFLFFLDRPLRFSFFFHCPQFSNACLPDRR